MMSSGAISVLHRHVAGDEDDRAVLAERARERQREAGERARAERRQEHAAEGLEAASRRASRPPPPCSTSSSSSTGCTVRTTNGRPTNVSAMTTPSGVNATWIPSGSSSRAEPAVLRVERRERDARRPRSAARTADRRARRRCAAREAVAHEHPGDQQAEDRVDARRDERRAEAQLEGGDGARSGHQRPEARRADERRCPAARSSTAGPARAAHRYVEREAHRQPEAGQNALSPPEREPPRLTCRPA